jgi:hypothetical protein
VRWCATIWVVGACGFRHGPTPASDTELDDAAPPDGVVGTTPRQQTTAVAGAGSPLSATLGSLPAAGDLLVMIGAANHGALAAVHGGGVTWQLATRSSVNTNVEIWYGITDGSSASVAIELPMNPLPIWMSVSEWPATATANLDRARSAAGITSPASAGAITTTSKSELVLFAVADASPDTLGSVPGWSSLTGVASSVTVQAEWFTLAPQPGELAPQVSETAHAWDAAIAALELMP